MTQEASQNTESNVPEVPSVAKYEAPNVEAHPTLKDRATSAFDSAKEKASHFAAGASEHSKNAAHKVSESAKHAGQSIADAGKTASGKVRENPGKSAAIATGVVAAIAGAITGALFYRRKNGKSGLEGTSTTGKASND